MTLKCDFLRILLPTWCVIYDPSKNIKYFLHHVDFHKSMGSCMHMTSKLVLNRIIGHQNNDFPWIQGGFRVTRLIGWCEDS